jgi:hypothetical protein
LLGKIAALSFILAIVGIAADISICPSNTPACVNTAPFEAGAFLFVGGLVALAVSGIGYAISWRSRTRATAVLAKAAILPITYDCPHCGAPINSTTDKVDAKCQFCGETSPVPRQMTETSGGASLRPTVPSHPVAGVEFRRLGIRRCPLCGYGFNKPDAFECKACRYRFEYSEMTPTSGGPGFRGLASGAPIFSVSGRWTGVGFVIFGAFFMVLAIIASFPNSYTTSYFILTTLMAVGFVVLGVWTLAVTPKMDFYGSFIRITHKAMTREILYSDIAGVSAEYRSGRPSRIRFVVKGDRKGYKIPQGAGRAIPNEKGTKTSLYTWLREKTRATTIE